MPFGRYEVTWGHISVLLQQQQRKMFHRNKCRTNSVKHRKQKEAQVRDFLEKQG